ncbi:hypothetical protein N7468_007311 [Penicillium chermesinum]|uniref:Uncharacterized protein n=1 Tax=Penicillium chermesinum TaxID=63820 RepID=A0A9W9TKG0_9EURO|nr:uncharacterized protein N7468_007311 [Penicillium chermesinum]KAJ5226086.1 hypothetical protein N7468_007311 [Penicillium chermesinum]
MAPAVTDFTQAIVEPSTTFLTTFTLLVDDPKPTSDYVTLTLTSPSTTVVEVNIAATPTLVLDPAQPKSHGLSGAAKGAIAGSILGVAVIALLLYCCCRRGSLDPEESLPSSPSRSPRQSPGQRPFPILKRPETVQIKPGPPPDNPPEALISVKPNPPPPPPPPPPMSGTTIKAGSRGETPEAREARIKEMKRRKALPPEPIINDSLDRDSGWWWGVVSGG